MKTVDLSRHNAIVVPLLALGANPFDAYAATGQSANYEH
jgi:hypothetical protein